RRAGGRRKFKESPNWAIGLMGRLVDANLIQVNERGHYRFLNGTESPEEGNSPFIIEQQIIEEDYFPSHHGPKVIGENYFPSSGTPDSPEDETRWWVKPELLDIPKRSKGKKGKKE
ncbi:MAG TPA: hypothetical protein VFB72_04315, partial [Verrucomicrobiae bacterium]|nr:hypothetical protein [Verrucomicrobiae bacterium]